MTTKMKKAIKDWIEVRRKFIMNEGNNGDGYWMALTKDDLKELELILKEE